LSKAREGIIVAGGNGAGADPTQLNQPSGIFVDETSGNLFVADWMNARVQLFKPNSRIGETVAGGNGAGSRLNQLSSPESVWVDKQNTVFVSDYANHRVVKWLQNAKEGILVVGGTQGNGADQLSLPMGLQFDKQGNLYVGDQGNNRVQKFILSDNCPSAGVVNNILGVSSMLVLLFSLTLMSLTRY